MFIKIVYLKETAYTDQTVQFPYLSSKGKIYIMVEINVDTDYILLEETRNRTEVKHTTASPE